MTPEQCEEAALLAEVYAQQFGDLTKTGLLSFARWLRTISKQPCDSPPSNQEASDADPQV